MENQDQDATKADEVKIDSTTKKPEEVTKRSIRVETWKKLQDGNSPYPKYVFNRISNFTGAEEAAKLLSETDEFKNATKIKVNADRPQDSVKLAVVENKKTLIVPARRSSSAVMVEINVPADVEAEDLKKYIRLDAEKEYGSELGIDNDIKLDVLVIGSCAVSREGHRIGRGNGYVDLDYGILQHLGIVTADTLIATTVHDCQVYDKLPLDLFTNYDVPVDMIVTPTEVIRVAKKLPRPEGLFWHILSERRLGVVPILKEIKEKEEKSGKIIILKSEDTDVETNRRSSRQRPGGRRVVKNNRRRFARNKAVSETDNENNEQPRQRRMQSRRYRRPKQSEGENTDKENSGNANNNPQQQQTRKRRNNREFCIKVSNIDKSSRLKDLKAELRKRGCNPMFISWKGYGKCYLHFAKRAGQDQAIDEIIDNLANLTLAVQKGETTKDVPLRVELIKRENAENRIETTDVTNRIETTDVTAV